MITKTIHALLLTLVCGLTLDAKAPLSTSEPIECTLKPIERSIIRKGSSPLFLLDAATSTNWSGYVGATNLSSPALNSVTAVSGSWNVPMLHSTPNASYCATWVGIDGFSSATVEQIGTAQNWISRSQQNYAWFEMYPAGAYEIEGFPVNIGDKITASVDYIGGGVFQMTIENITHHVYFTVPTSYTHSNTAHRSCAEWIMEAPSSGGGVLPLADFGNATFVSCEATINSVNAPINNTHWKNESIEMETGGGTIKALPSSVYSSGLNFMVSWEHE